MTDEIKEMEKEMELNEEALKDVAGGANIVVNDRTGHKKVYFEKGDWVYIWRRDDTNGIGVIVACDRIEYTEKGDERYYTVQTQRCGIVSGISQWELSLVHNVRDNKK